MSKIRLLAALPASPSMSQRAAADLRYIRDAMAGSGRFTAVPGLGAIYMGLVALITSQVAGQSPNAETWLAIWILGACCAFAGGAWSLWSKARRQGLSLTSGVGRKFLLGLCPSLVSGMVLTAVLWQVGATDWLPVMWMLLYGSAILSAGSLSVPVVPITGAVFMFFGIVAALCPLTWAPSFLTISFCGLHWISGTFITLRHGG